MIFIVIRFPDSLFEVSSQQTFQLRAHFASTSITTPQCKIYLSSDQKLSARPLEKNAVTIDQRNWIRIITNIHKEQSVKSLE